MAMLRIFHIQQVCRAPFTFVNFLSPGSEQMSDNITENSAENSTIVLRPNFSEYQPGQIMSYQNHNIFVVAIIVFTYYVIQSIFDINRSKSTKLYDNLFSLHHMCNYCPYRIYNNA